MLSAADGFVTVIEAVSGCATSAAVIAACSKLDETNVVALADPFQFTTASEAKPVPLTVRVKAEPPAVALDGEIIHLGAAQQIGFEIRLVRGQGLVILDRQHDGTLCAVAGDGLRPFGTGALNQLAEPCFRILDLPRRHLANRLSVLFDYNIGILVELQ